jgi:holliday junction DNA helicase RuvA
VIGFLRGEVHWVEMETLTLLAGGVGYEVHCTPATLAEAQPGQNLDVWIYTQVREDAIVLFGFRSLAEKHLFLSLIKVNGIGPKSALAILGASPIANLIELINQGDAKGLSGLPKVGKKTAEQIILTLKGKLVSAAESGGGTVPAGGRPKVRQEIVSALVHLGFRLADVERVVEQLPAQTDLETGVRESLAALTN